MDTNSHFFEGFTSLPPMRLRAVPHLVTADARDIGHIQASLTEGLTCQELDEDSAYGTSRDCKKIVRSGVFHRHS
jgi:hypothetical protein